MQETPPFNEVIISWNTNRPLHGKYRIYVRILLADWSEWIHYADWGANEQSTYEYTHNLEIKSSQDTINIVSQNNATAFEVIVYAVDETPSDDSVHLFVSTERLPHQFISECSKKSILLQVPGISQFSLNNPIGPRICSPVSLTSVLQFLSKTQKINPLEFASHVVDHHWGIYGNWILNCAQAYVELESAWFCWVERISSFNRIMTSLHNHIPVIASVRGPLLGSAQDYSEGHLMVVCGYDHSDDSVICMDPAFPKHHQTLVKYPFSEFLNAWERRGFIAYMFEKSS